MELFVPTIWRSSSAGHSRSSHCCQAEIWWSIWPSDVSNAFSALQYSLVFLRFFWRAGAESKLPTRRFSVLERGWTLVRPCPRMSKNQALFRTGRADGERNSSESRSVWSKHAAYTTFDMLHDRLGWRLQPFFLRIATKYIRSGITCLHTGRRESGI
jgi:hypothetical protein